MNEKKMAKLFALNIILVIAVYFLFLHFTKSHPVSARMGALGGLIAVYGVILIAMPVIRVGGPYHWIYNLTLKDVINDMNRAKFLKATKEEKKQMIKEKKEKQEEEEVQKEWDLIVQMIFGPLLIGIGTFINGISGLFD